MWTWWNYRKSRTYSKKLDLQLIGNVQIVGQLYIDIIAKVTNAGASQHMIGSADSYCTISAVMVDLSESPLHIFNISSPNGMLEPGGSMDAAIVWIAPHSPDLAWLKISLRTVSGDLEWNTTSILRVKYEEEQRRRAL